MYSPQCNPLSKFDLDTPLHAYCKATASYPAAVFHRPDQTTDAWADQVLSLGFWWYRRPGNTSHTVRAVPVFTPLKPNHLSPLNPCCGMRAGHPADRVVRNLTRPATSPHRRAIDGVFSLPAVLPGYPRLSLTVQIHIAWVSIRLSSLQRPVSR